MGLLGEIQKQAPKKGPVCHMAGIEAGLSAKDRSELHQAFADSSIAATAIQRALKARGHTVDASGLRRHRKGECSCGHA